MNLPFKYTSSFANKVKIETFNKESISEASLQSLNSIIPEGIDFEKNIDLIGVAFNAAVANKFNKNGDGIDSETAAAIKDYFIHKPTNIEHQRDKVVGHIVGASFSSYGDNQVIEDEAINNAAIDGEPFNIALSAVIYKGVNPEFAALVEKSTDESSQFYQKVSASWEIGFNDYDLALGSEDLKDAEIIEDEELKKSLSKHLKAYGGSGKTDDGVEIYRLIKGDIYPIGIGFTANPAASVKGLVTHKSSEDDSGEAALSSKEFEKIKISKIKSKEKISQKTKDNVNSYNIQKPYSIMEQEILEQFKEVMEANTSSKKLSEEAVANMTKIFHDAIVEKSTQWQSEKEAIVTQKDELQSTTESQAKELEDIKVKLQSTEEELHTIKSEVIAAEAVENFNNRMSELDDTFELEDEDRQLVASELKELKDEEAYATYKEKLNILWKHKTKSFKEEQEKAIEEKIEAAVQERLKTSESSESSEEEQTEQEVVEEAIENVEVEEEALANNNGSTTEESLSIREKFAKAFSEDNVTIQY
jgi:hypothetical protein